MKTTYLPTATNAINKVGEISRSERLILGTFVTETQGVFADALMGNVAIGKEDFLTPGGGYKYQQAISLLNEEISRQLSSGSGKDEIKNDLKKYLGSNYNKNERLYDMLEATRLEFFDPYKRIADVVTYNEENKTYTINPAYKERLKIYINLIKDLKIFNDMGI